MSTGRQSGGPVCPRARYSRLQEAVLLIDALERGLIELFRTRRRIHVPTLATWNLATDIDRGLRELGSYDGSLTQRSFANDLLIAATARELGAMLVTRNLGDFELIRRVVPIHFQPPWPATG